MMTHPGACMMDKPGGLVHAFLAIALVSGAWSSVAAQQQVKISSGQQLVDVVQGVLSPPNQNSTVAQLVVDTNISLRDATFINQNTSSPFGSLKLSIARGLPGVVLLDTALRSGLLPELTGSSTLSLSQLSITNLCSQVRVWDKAQGLTYITASGLYLFGPEGTQKTKQYLDLVLFVPPAEVLMFIYWSLIQNSVFTTITSAMPTYLMPSINFQGRVSNMSRYSITFLSQSRPDTQSTNVELHSTDDPALGPLAPTLLPPAFCNGRPLTAAELTFNTTLFPLYLAYDSDALQASLSNAGLYTQNKMPQDPAPVVLLTGTTVLGGVNGQYAAVTLRAECMLHGPLQQGPPASMQYATLNMGKVANILQLAVRGRLFMAYLTLSQLITASLDSGPTGYMTALPLWSINMVSRQSQQVFMDHITLSLPQADYAALLSAALRGSDWKTASTTGPLMKGIDIFTLAPGFVPTTTSPSIYLSVYQGWGVYGTNMTFTSSVPLEPSYPLPDLAAPSDPSPAPSSDSSSSTALAVGLGVGIGVGLALCAAVIGGLLWRRKKRAAAAARMEVLRQESEKAVQTAITINGAARPGGGSPQGQASPGPPSKSSSIQKSSRSLLGGGEGSEKTPGGGRSAVSQKSGGFESAQLNVASLHAAVKARQTAGGYTDSPPVSGTAGGPSSGGSNSDPKKAVQQAVGALGNMDADKLTLLGVLGRGTWGTVYRGRWRNLDVAVKTVLFSNRTDGKGSLPHERAIMEAAVCTSVAHRNVVATYHYDIKPVMAVEEGQGLQVALSHSGMDLLTTEWKLYLVQEWCNTSMGAAMRSGLLHNQASGTPLMDLLLTLLLDMTSGLSYLHDKNIIHGDLKPENIMLKMDSSSPIGVVAKITDFGLSTTLGPQATHVSNFNSGTPFYVAPEVVAEGRVTKGSDIYSFGVVMWELYHGSTPWVRDKSGAYALRPSFTTFSPGAPAAYATLTQQCSQRDSRLRPTLAQVIASLQAMHAAWLAGYDSLEAGTASGLPNPVTLRQGPAAGAVGLTMATAGQQADGEGQVEQPAANGTVAGQPPAATAATTVAAAAVAGSSVWSPGTARIPSKLTLTDLPVLTIQGGAGGGGSPSGRTTPASGVPLVARTNSAGAMGSVGTGGGRGAGVVLNRVPSGPSGMQAGMRRSGLLQQPTGSRLSIATAAAPELNGDGLGSQPALQQEHGQSAPPVNKPV